MEEDDKGLVDGIVGKRGGGGGRVLAGSITAKMRFLDLRPLLRFPYQESFSISATARLLPFCFCFKLSAWVGQGIH
jgi:hypothetical protein